ncbi:MAG: DUF3568 domain-containing protein [Planctomycetes bacterium]|nr:DUF3568 domain-containing protein [Planctomycetota bacterium]
MKAHALMLAVFGIGGGLLAPGCSTYHDPATGEKATYGIQTLKARLDLDVGTLYAAAQRAAVEANLKVVRTAEDGISGEIWAYDAQRDLVQIRLGALPEGRTLLAINIGVFGDKNKSIVLFEYILDNLNRAERFAAACSGPWADQAVRPPRGVAP